MFSGMHYVYEVYKEKSFSLAAANLHISQPSLSANVKRIEERVGYPIFDRSTKPLGLTECGREYIRTAELIMAAENEFASFINDLGQLKTGTLTLGGSNFFSSWVLPRIIAAFSDTYPDLEISLTEAKSSELIDMLQNTQIDFIVDNKEVDPEVFEKLCIGREELLLSVPADFEINAKLKEYQVPHECIVKRSYEEIPTVPLEYFKDYPFLFLHPENDTGIRARRICRENDFHPDVVLFLDQQLTAYNIASTGVGATFVGDLLLSRVPENPNLVHYRLDSDEKMRNIYLCWKQKRYLSHAMNTFIETMKNTEL